MLLTGAALGGLPAPSRPAATRVVAPAPLPAPDAPLPHTAGGLAADFAATTRALRAAEAGWRGAGRVPREVTYLALHQQRVVRVLAARRGLGDAALARLAGDVRGEARDTVLGERRLAAIPRSPGPPPRVGPAPPAARLRRYYAVAQRRYGVPWSVLAAVNFVESQFGRLRNASEAGARGPMQFMPATWREYGRGGDIEDSQDAILAAARYLRRAGAAHDLAAALFAYNHSRPYVRAIRRFATRMRTDARVFLTYYAWQVYAGGLRLTGPTGTRAATASRTASIDASLNQRRHASAHGAPGAPAAGQGIADRFDGHEIPLRTQVRFTAGIARERGLPLSVDDKDQLARCRRAALGNVEKRPRGGSAARTSPAAERAWPRYNGQGGRARLAQRAGFAARPGLPMHVGPRRYSLERLPAIIAPARLSTETRLERRRA